MKYDLQRLGAVGFQDLTSALAIKALGAHVRPMGRGRDGGRDMLVTDGVLVWSENEHYAGVESWDGTTVFQVKHKETLEGPQKDAATLWQHLKHELEQWASPESERGPVPHYFVFVTNIPLTPFPGAGGFDSINAKIRKFLADLRDESSEDHLSGPDKVATRNLRQARRDRMRNLRQWRLWDGIQIVGLLDAHQSVRRAFAGFLTAGDVLEDLAGLSTHLNQDELGPALGDHARWALLAERGVYFDDAGGESKGVPVEQVAIDLPVLVEDGQVADRIVRHVLRRGDHVLRPSLTSMKRPRHIVVTGAPGNGKSTIAKFLTHAYRTKFVSESAGLGEEHVATVGGTVRALRGMSAAVPAHRRWPITVDLAKFAISQAANADYTLLQYIVSQLNRQVSSKNVPRWEMWKWLQAWPSFVVLDGLDEVTEPSVRQVLVADIEAFVADCESKDCDALILVTTRPTGYENELGPSTFERVDLADLTIDDALRYGRLVTQVRVPNDEIRRQGIIKALEDAARSETLRHLLRTPLQTLIMSIIAESKPRFTPGRFDLFWGYYKTIEQREQNKDLGYSVLLRDHASEVLDLHRRVGLRLQRQSETASGSDAVLSPTHLRDTAWQVLDDAGYDPSNRDRRLLEQILSAATHRLVLLTPRSAGGYGFDVRSLQELMAALALTTGTLDDALPRLRKIAASPHWRNTFLFAAGRFFVEPQPHQQQAITDLILTIDDGVPERLSSIVPVGPELAHEVVDDGMAAQPRHLHPLILEALRVLRQPEGFDAVALGSTLATVAGASEAARALIADGLRAALAGDEISRMNTDDLQRWFREVDVTVMPSPEARGLGMVKRDPARAVESIPDADWVAFWDVVRGYAEDQTEPALTAAGGILERVASGSFPEDWAIEVRGFLRDPDVAFVLDEALRHVAPGSPILLAALRHRVMPTLWRRPVDA